MKWGVIKLADAPLEIIDGDRGKNYPKSDEFHSEGYCLFLSTANVREQGFDFSQCQFITDQKDGLLRKGKLKRNDIVLTTRGTIGNVAYYSSSVPYEHVRINSGMVILRADEEKLLSSYLYAFVRSPLFRSQTNSLRSGSAQPQLPIRDMKYAEIPIPSIAEQIRISDIMSAYDDLIENNQRRIRILEDMAQNLYREWFVHFRFPGHEKTKMTDSPLGLIPQGWEIRGLGQCVDFIKDTAKPHNLEPDYKYLPIDCLPRKCLSVSEYRPLEEAQSSLVLFKREDILFGAMRPYFHKVVIAPFDGVTRATCFVFRPLSKAYRCWSLLRLFQDETVDYSNAHSKGATIPYASWEDGMARMPVVFPPAEIAHKFEEAISSSVDWIINVHHRQESLKKSRDLLLPKLISGEIDLSTAAYKNEEAA